MLSAILFDLDGTLANTDPIHFSIWQELLAQYNIHCDRTFYQTYISGRTNAEIIQDLLPQLSSQEAIQLADLKEERYRHSASTLTPMPGLNQILEWMEQQQLKQAVVTNAPRENAYHMLTALNLTEVFPIVILAEDAPPGKPDPAPYNLALSRLGVQATEAIAFEDSPSGIRAAVAAGIVTIGVASTHASEHLIEAGAVMTIEDFTNQQLWQILTHKIKYL
ncbi:HAD-superfamily hydrolase, subfamily IA, variant 3 [Stanieria cyanosphaera PCC 7437]|uniref:HAD-superfamily hydrolase, subfamily IA, variant 3 n=1 Tax=Stanieria cyanosphaera (strain ATCC 29371 / PCC 7437) TaxID=111780 RepID=K9XTI5_STAC7|nr:HAD family phosphatase [Stanieria cyanosphaera]AFZ35374.1 HAD-superfamily hydrolase, subfamily IA, variant 3 [Stanieria cyanosphaera PCC 7437]